MKSSWSISKYYFLDIHMDAVNKNMLIVSVIYSLIIVCNIIGIRWSGEKSSSSSTATVNSHGGNDPKIMVE
jgi:hypothetical protein